ncbi:futalosine hydrolase [Cohnella rhizosphaerae]|uniref:Futalosine hydrolase n=2 Tax=Cohnella rhizosphaerae TaxID=1457232 RepID=A0A9X4KVL0_9BACL|nr:futalosine hydrolase [Cohnella rhizosphaerae]MDG0811969.1 futalosine hydrolase [Cohnella rhizosphaerae]
MTELTGHPGKTRSPSEARILVMTAVEAERDAVLRGLDGDGRFEVRLCGVGPASAAARTAVALGSGDPWTLVVSAGIAGGYPEVAPVGTLAVGTDAVAADLGVETAEGFASVEELGFGASKLAADAKLAEELLQALNRAGLVAASGPIVTASTATGTAATAAVRSARVPGAVAEGMEGYGVAIAATYADKPFIELRAISNAVGPRDRDAWRIGDALTALSAAFAILKEVELN